MFNCVVDLVPWLVIPLIFKDDASCRPNRRIKGQSKSSVVVFKNKSLTHEAVFLLDAALVCTAVQTPGHQGPRVQLTSAYGPPRFIIEHRIHLTQDIPGMYTVSTRGV